MNRPTAYRTLFIFCLSFFVLSGCTVGPDYKRPEEDIPQKWVEVSQGVSTDEPADAARWWTVFNDPTLDWLIARSMDANKDLKLARARVLEARAQRVSVASGLFPTLSGKGSYTINKESSTTSPASGASQQLSQMIPGYSASSGSNGGTFSNGLDLFQGELDASWELDFFGRVRRSVEAASADLAASQENYRDTLVTLLSEVSVNYLTLRGAQLRLVITKKNMEAMRQTVQLTQEKFAAGLSSDLDVSQAKAQLATTEAQVPSLETTVRQSIYRLATLLGSPPDPLVARLSEYAEIPGIPPEVPVGLPSDLLRRRPDVRRAEWQLAAATARIGVATADLYPRFSLTGALGQASMDLADITRSASSFWSFGPSFNWNLFTAGKVRAEIEAQKARTEQALATYEKAILTAIQDVESALVAYSKEQARRQSLVAAVESSQRAYDISSELYARGLVDFLRVLESQRALYVNEELLAVSEQQVSGNLVALYKALGGGWKL
ncbi:MAG: efflux transporter outer membrane subunit [Desulfobacteraceae bacterium]|nr:efflux transporter outer membrane subunit [Desulfobacteraceae bacterium]